MRQGTKWRRKARTLTAIEKRHNTNHQGPHSEEEEVRQRNRTSGARAEILIYDVTICRNDILWNPT
jgi:hypothetical protein